MVLAIFTTTKNVCRFAADFHKKNVFGLQNSQIFTHTQNDKSAPKKFHKKKTHKKKRFRLQNSWIFTKNVLGSKIPEFSHTQNAGFAARFSQKITALRADTREIKISEKSPIWTPHEISGMEKRDAHFFPELARFSEHVAVAKISMCQSRRKSQRGNPKSGRCSISRRPWSVLYGLGDVSHQLRTRHRKNLSRDVVEIADRNFSFE